MTQKVRERPDGPTARPAGKRRSPKQTEPRPSGGGRTTEVRKVGLREPIRSIVEPVLVERRRQVADEVRRMRLQRLKILGGIALVATVIVGALFSPLFDIDRITVSGSAHVTPQQIEQISGLEHRTALVSANIDGATAALRSNPWIAYAKIRRNYPGTISITVAEEHPILLLRSTQGSALLSENGRILEFEPTSGGHGDPSSVADYDVVTAEFDGRIAEDSPTGSPLPGRHVSPEVRRLLRVAENLTAAVATRLDHIAVDPDADLELVLKDGSVVLMGPVEDLTAKLTATAAVLGQVDLECLAQIDVRNPTRATVKRRDGCQIPDSAT